VSKAKPPRKWTAKELKERIGRRHPLDKGWFTVTEFCPTSGRQYDAGRMDALAVCLYKGRGFATHGFEVKVDRSDWLSELNNPSKNSHGLAEVDFWWLVVPSTEIAKPEELPPKWGLFTCSGKGLRVTKRAERLKDEAAPFGRPFVVSLLWKLAYFKTPGEKALEEARKEGRKAGLARAANSPSFEVDEITRERDSLKGTIADFEARSGCNIHEWNAKELGKVAKLLAENDLTLLVWALEDARDKLGELTPTLGGALEAAKKLEAVSTKPPR
jgi:hypothetical protein